MAFKKVFVRRTGPRATTECGLGTAPPPQRLNSYWRWKCEECGYEFILALVRLPDPCHRCGSEWFLKIGEAATKESRTD